ncbi:class I SAM-dependent methyltransferase [Paenibacillus glufosinatiresistens]|uniref:class I SAM-dependent methyltransferase n=1 Tax=Paenibacillus glufosinatiresistens TaxID=3070657 RepID=UPI00286E4731|nr:class I SAM-dependent methyltransferase [Paenibacillus sp. YX.27]
MPEDNQEAEAAASYWERRFAAEGMIWGGAPSPTVAHALALFRSEGVRTVWVPGAGYGRNTKALSEEFQVSGTEISASAVELARDWDPRSDIRQGSILEPQEGEREVDGVFCYDVIHLFLAGDRGRLARQIRRRLRPGGVLYLTCFSDEDVNCGRGEQREPGTFVYKPGKTAHFFAFGELQELFPGFEVMEEAHITEALPGPEGLHSYRLRIWAARAGSRSAAE